MKAAYKSPNKENFKCEIESTKKIGYPIVSLKGYNLDQNQLAKMYRDIDIKLDEFFAKESS